LHSSAVTDDLPLTKAALQQRNQQETCKSDNLDSIYLLQEQVNHAVVVEKGIIAQVIVNIKIMFVIIVGKEPCHLAKVCRAETRLEQKYKGARWVDIKNEYGDQETILYDAIFCVKDTWICPLKIELELDGATKSTWELFSL